MAGTSASGVRSFRDLIVGIDGPEEKGYEKGGLKTLREAAAMDIDESLVKEIVRRIRSVAVPHKIILFGSAATGRMTHDSDIDLLVVEADPGDRRKKCVRIDETLGGLGYPFDIIVISTDWFEASKNVIGGIAYPANKYGKVIYEAA